MDEYCSAFLREREAKRVTLGLVVIDQRVFEEFGECALYFVTCVAAFIALAEYAANPIMGGSLVGVVTQATAGVKAVAFEC